MATAVLSSEEEQSYNSDYSDAESEKAKTPKKSRKVTHEKWSGGSISKLIDEYEARPCLWNIFCDDYHNRDVTGKAKKELEVSLRTRGKLESKWIASNSLLANVLFICPFEDFFNSYCNL